MAVINWLRLVRGWLSVPGFFPKSVWVKFLGNMLKFAKAKESKGKFVLQLVLFTPQKILEDNLDSSKIK